MDDEELMTRVGQAMRDELSAERLSLGTTRDARPERDALHLQVADAVLEELESSCVSVLPLPAARRTRPAKHAWFVAGGVLAAALALLCLRTAMPDAPMPAYHMSLRGGDRAVRGANEPGGALQLHAHSQLEWLLRPDQPVQTKPHVHIYYRQAQGELLPLPAAAELSPQGAVRISGRLDSWGLSVGKTTLIAIIAPNSALPSSNEQLDMMLLSPPSGWRVLRAELEIRP